MAGRILFAHRRPPLGDRRRHGARRPDIGLLIYQNLATGMGAKLKRSELALVSGQ